MHRKKITKPPFTFLLDMILIRLSNQKPSLGIGFNSRATSIKNVFTLVILLAIHMKKRIGLQRTLVEKGANVSIY